MTEVMRSLWLELRKHPVIIGVQIYYMIMIGLTCFSIKAPYSYTWLILILVADTNRINKKCHMDYIIPANKKLNKTMEIKKVLISSFIFSFFGLVIYLETINQMPEIKYDLRIVVFLIYLGAGLFLEAAHLKICRTRVEYGELREKLSGPVIRQMVSDILLFSIVVGGMYMYIFYELGKVKFLSFLGNSRLFPFEISYLTGTIVLLSIRVYLHIKVFNITEFE